MEAEQTLYSVYAMNINSNIPNSLHFLGTTLNNTLMSSTKRNQWKGLYIGVKAI